MLKRSSKARAIAYRTNSDFEGKPCSLDAAASSFACSFVSLRLIVSTEIVIRWYYLTLIMGVVNVKRTSGAPVTICQECFLNRILGQSRIYLRGRNIYLVGGTSFASMERRKRVVKVTRRGQTTIPAEFRRRHRIKEGSRLVVEDRGDALLVRPVPRLEDEGGSLADKATLEEALETLRRSREDED